jgi:hypothetical protein
LGYLPTLTLTPLLLQLLSPKASLGEDQGRLLRAMVLAAT